MKLLVFSIDFLVGLGALVSFAVGMVSHYKADFKTRTSCTKVFAICAGLLIILAIVTTVLGIPMTGFDLPSHAILSHP
jgi:hypothetical protein